MPRAIREGPKAAWGVGRHLGNLLDLDMVGDKYDV